MQRKVTVDGIEKFSLKADEKASSVFFLRPVDAVGKKMWCTNTGQSKTMKGDRKAGFHCIEITAIMTFYAE